jgi:hypothetical protein
MWLLKMSKDVEPYLCVVLFTLFSKKNKQTERGNWDRDDERLQVRVGQRRNIDARNS